MDGPLQFDVDTAGMTPKIITKYGKEFSIVEIPYSFKLLMQELTSMNVQMRIITAENIDQLTATGNTRLSDILTNIGQMNLRTPKIDTSTTTLNDLEKAMNKAQSRFESKSKALKQKYSETNGVIPEHSYDMRELNRLEDIYYEAKREYYEFKKELHKDKIEEVVGKIKDLQVKYANADKKDLKEIEKKYYEYISFYKMNTGTNYTIPLGAISIQKSIKPVNEVEQSLLNLSPIKNESASTASASTASASTASASTASASTASASTASNEESPNESPNQAGSNNQSGGSKIIKLN